MINAYRDVRVWTWTGKGDRSGITVTAQGAYFDAIELAIQQHPGLTKHDDLDNPNRFDLNSREVTHESPNHD
jgi:hypothetical protein